MGTDFYFFWGVPAAMRLTGHTLGSPHKNGHRYYETLKAYAAGSNDAKLRAAARLWPTEPVLSPSPLLFTTFTAFSSDYTFSLAVFQTLQFGSFLGVFLLLGYLYRCDLFYLLCLALLCILVYQPLLSDLRVSNLGCLQLMYPSAMLFLASALEGARSFARRAGLGALLLAAHIGVRHGRRLFVAAALPAAAVTALFVITPCLYFGSWTVWQEWYDAVYGSNAFASA